VFSDYCILLILKFRNFSININVGLRAGQLASGQTGPSLSWPAQVLFFFKYGLHGQRLRVLLLPMGLFPSKNGILKIE